ncbi:hypothetical protein HO589_01775 [Streptococcus suis]|nr:hypothetical protein [Streptococcus suis]NQK18046.1 hypothetical protein [Streptococcus suis]
MNQEQTNQALRLTIQDLTNQLTEALATKNLMAIQLAEAQQIIEQLQSDIDEFTKEAEEVDE